MIQIKIQPRQLDQVRRTAGTGAAPAGASRLSRILRDQAVNLRQRKRHGRFAPRAADPPTPGFGPRRHFVPALQPFGSADIDFDASGHRVCGYTASSDPQIDLPDGRDPRIPVKLRAQKYFCFSEGRISRMLRSSRLACGGAYRDRHDT